MYSDICSQNIRWLMVFLRSTEHLLMFKLKLEKVFLNHLKITLWISRWKKCNVISTTVFYVHGLVMTIIILIALIVVHNVKPVLKDRDSCMKSSPRLSFCTEHVTLASSFWAIINGFKTVKQNLTINRFAIVISDNTLVIYED